MGWEKFALRGDTYARALTNAAQRAGRNVSPGMFDHIAQQPQAKLKPGLSTFVRERGALTPTPQQQSMQSMLAKTPWAGSDHGGVPHAEAHFNALLRRRGLEQNTPAGMPNVNQRIHERFGAPQRAPQDDTAVVDRKPRARGGDPLSFQEYPTPRGRNPIAQPAQDTRVGMGVPPQAPRRVDHSQQQARSHQQAVNQRLQSPGAAFSGTRIMSRTPAGPSTPPPALMQTPQYRPVQTQAANEGTAVFKSANAGAIAAGIGVPLVLGSGMLLGKPGIQSNVKNLLSSKGSTEDQDKNNALPEQALGHASAIHQALLQRGLNPTTMRIGIDAPPGSGKTTLARALAQHTGMKHYGLDWEPGNAWKSTIGLGRNVESTPHAPRAGEILEHYLLNRTHDPELFDAQIHIKRDPKVIREQLTRRGNAAYIGDTMDLEKSLGVADLGFDTLGGDMVDIGDGIQLKLRPQEGWGNQLDHQLMQRGINPEGLSRHEKLLSLHGGKRTTGAGWTPYVKNPFTTGQTLALGASIPLGVMAAKALFHAPKVAGVADVWHDLSPLMRRTLVGGGVGAALGGLADDEHRGRGMLAGGLAGAGAGALYNAARPIKPAAMPGTYRARIRPSSRTLTHDYHTPHALAERPGWHRAKHTEEERITESYRKPVEDYDEFSMVPHTHDPSKRGITVSPYIETEQDLGHLRADHTSMMNRSDVRKRLGDLLGETWTGKENWKGEIGPDAFGPTPHQYPRFDVPFVYEGPTSHDSRESPQINELRRLLRTQR